MSKSKVANKEELYSHLLKGRTIFFNTDFSHEAVGEAVAQLLYLDDKSDDTIYLYINSPGGFVYAGLALMDTMNYIKSPVATVAIGHAMSCGSLILTSGEKGKRYALPNARIMVHQVSSGTRGTYTDQQISLNETKTLNDSLKDIFLKTTGQPKKVIDKWFDRDTFMSAEGALKYGIIDEIITKKL